MAARHAQLPRLKCYSRSRGPSRQLSRASSPARTSCAVLLQLLPGNLKELNPRRQPPRETALRISLAAPQRRHAAPRAVARVYARSKASPSAPNRCEGGGPRPSAVRLETDSVWQTSAPCSCTGRASAARRRLADRAVANTAFTALHPPRKLPATPAHVTAGRLLSQFWGAEVRQNMVFQQ